MFSNKNGVYVKSAGLQSLDPQATANNRKQRNIAAGYSLP
jgi:hypothetical protein